MPAFIPVIAAVAGAVASAGAAWALTGVIASTFLLSLVSGIAGAVVSFAVSALGGALAGGPKRGSTADAPLADRKRTIRESASPRRVVIGRVKVGGVLIYAQGIAAGGVNDKYLMLVLALAGHQCHSIETIYLGDDSIEDPKFAGLVRWEFKRGTSDQVAPDWFVTETGGKWSAEHRGRGCALLYLKLTKNESAFPNGLPEVTAVMKGLDQIHDPRTGALGYTTNAALVVAWYLTSPLGLNDDQDAIDEATLIEAANICDERVPLLAGGTEGRYRATGTFSLDEQPKAVLSKLLSACAGDAIQAGGCWYVEPAAWRPSNRVITADEMRGAITIARNRAFRDLANGVRATYVREAAGWEETDAPPLLDDAARIEDGGEPVYQDLELPFTLSGTAAQRIMQIRLRRLRAQRSYRIPAMLHHVALRPGSVVAVEPPTGPRDTIRLAGWTLDEDGAGVTLSGEQDAPDIYAWNAATDERPLPTPGTVEKPTGTDVLTPVLTLTAPTAPEPSSIAAGWTAVTGAAGYELEWRGPAGGAFTVTAQAGTSATISTGGRAEMRVRADRGDGEFSAYDSAPFPADLTRFVTSGAAGGATVEFSGADAAQVFANSTDDFATSTLAGTLSGGVGLVSLAAGDWYLWARPVSAKGAVGAEVGSILVTAEDPATGGSIGSGEGTGGTATGGEGAMGGSAGEGSDGEGGEGGDSGGET